MQPTLLCPAVVWETTCAMCSIKSDHGCNYLCLTSLFKQQEFGWLCCKQIPQLPFRCISDKVAAQLGIWSIIRPHSLLPR